MSTINSLNHHNKIKKETPKTCKDTLINRTTLCAFFHLIGVPKKNGNHHGEKAAAAATVAKNMDICNYNDMPSRLWIDTLAHQTNAANFEVLN